MFSKRLKIYQYYKQKYSATGLEPTTTLTSDFEPVSSKEFLDTQATIERRFTLKRVRDMTRTYSQKYSANSNK